MSKELKSLAAQECCNYISVGACDIKNYCYMEPKDTEFRCRIFCDLPCGWFQKAVLPIKPEFTGFYRQLLDEGPVEEVADAKTRTCSCGALFIATSNRQVVCAECRKKRILETDRSKKRKRRLKG